MARNHTDPCPEPYTLLWHALIFFSVFCSILFVSRNVGHLNPSVLILWVANAAGKRSARLINWPLTLSHISHMPALRRHNRNPEVQICTWVMSGSSGQRGKGWKRNVPSRQMWEEWDQHDSFLFLTVRESSLPPSSQLDQKYFWSRNHTVFTPVIFIAMQGPLWAP